MDPQYGPVYNQPATPGADKPADKPVNDWLAPNSFIGQLGSGGMAAMNSATLGLTDWLIPKIFGDKFINQMSAQMLAQTGKPFGKENPVARGVGNLAGALVGGFGEAPKLAVQGVEMLAREAPALAKAAKVIANGGVGAIEGGIQSGMTEASAGGSPIDIIKQGLLGAGLGAGGGALGGALAGAIPRLVQGAEKSATGAVNASAGLSKRLMRGALMRAKGPLGKAGAPLDPTLAEDVAGQTADEITRIKGWQEGAIKQDWKQTKAGLDAVRDAAGPQFQALRGAEALGTASAPGKYLNPQDLADLQALHGKPVVDEALSQLQHSMGGTKGFENLKQKLYANITAGAKVELKDADKGQAMQDIARSVLGNMEKDYFGVAQAAEQAGTLTLPPGIKGVKDLYTRYRMQAPLATADALEEIAPKKFNTGSPTAEKLGMMAVLGGGGALAGSSQGQDPIDRIKNAAIGGLFGAGLARGGAALATRGIAATRPFLRSLAGLAEKVPEMAPQIAATTGRLASNASQLGSPETLQNAQTMPLVQGGTGIASTPGQAQAAQEGAQAGQALASGSMDAYRAAIQGKLGDLWDQAGMEMQFPGMKSAFIAYADQATGGYAPEKTAGFLYSDPKEARAFVQAVNVNKMMNSSLQEAAATGGGAPILQNIPGINQIPGVGVPEPEKEARAASYASLLGNLQDVAKANNIDPKVVKAQLDGIVHGGASLAEKRKRISALMQNYGINMNELSRWGIA